MNLFVPLILKALLFFADLCDSVFQPRVFRNVAKLLVLAGLGLLQ